MDERTKELVDAMMLSRKHYAELIGNHAKRANNNGAAIPQKRVIKAAQIIQALDTAIAVLDGGGGLVDL